jgi:hypothetical protein
MCDLTSCIASLTAKNEKERKVLFETVDDCITQEGKETSKDVVLLLSCYCYSTFEPNTVVMTIKCKTVK